MSNGKGTALPESPRSCRRGKCELQKTVSSGVWCKWRCFYSLHLALRTARRRGHAPYAYAGRRMTRTLPHAYRITGFFRGIRLLRFDRTSFLQKSALQHQSIGKSRKSSVGKTSCDIGSFGNVYAAVLSLLTRLRIMHIYVQLTAALVSTGKRVQRVRRKMLFAIGIYKAM